MPISIPLDVGTRLESAAVKGKLPGASSIISMATLFQVVKRTMAQQQLREQHAAASRAAGAVEEERERASRQENLDRMRQQTKSQLALSMGVSPVMMGGGTGAGDPTTAAFITQAATKPPAPDKLPLGMI